MRDDGAAASAGRAGSEWSREENEVVVADYLQMLRNELAGVPYNKAAHNRAMQQLLPQRSRSSIEFKHQNISAILLKLDCMYIVGYQPMPNTQRLLVDIVGEQVRSAPDLLALADASAARQIESPPVVKDLLAMRVDPPAPLLQQTSYREKAATPPQLGINFLERESKNRSLGRAGEELVVAFERARLIQLGKPTLASRIDHVSSTRGDGDGYDISSFEESGKPRLIEVKTTKYGPFTPFYASRNEVLVSEARAPEYFVYRMYNFEREPEFFALAGSMRETCVLDPTEFRARLPTR